MKIKHYGLIVGLVLVIISFLFFGREQNLYQLLLIGGIAISLTFYWIILSTNDSIKAKLIWTFVIVISIFIQWLSEPILIKNSYLIYLTTHKAILKEVNYILSPKCGEITILNDSVIDKSNLLSTKEKEQLNVLKQDLNVYMISKSDKGVYYGLWGFLDIRIGLTYWTDSQKLDDNYKSLIDNWYY